MDTFKGLMSENPSVADKRLRGTYEEASTSCDTSFAGDFRPVRQFQLETRRGAIWCRGGCRLVGLQLDSGLRALDGASAQSAQAHRVLNAAGLPKAVSGEAGGLEHDCASRIMEPDLETSDGLCGGSP
jgi:hypothetical protein